MLFLNTIRLLTVLFVITLISCQSDKTQGGYDSKESTVENTAKTNDGPPPVGSLSGDTLNIGGKFVLFFGPVEKADSTGKTTTADLKQFKASSVALIDSLSSKSDIKAVYSTASFFRIYTTNGSIMVISKNALNEEAGLLISDGTQPPTIKKGILSSEEYYQLIKTYFFLN